MNIYIKKTDLNSKCQSMFGLWGREFKVQRSGRLRNGNNWNPVLVVRYENPFVYYFLVEYVGHHVNWVWVTRYGGLISCLITLLHQGTIIVL